MGRRPAKFTQSDLTKAIKAAARAGVNMAVEISKDGTIRMVQAAPQTIKLEAGNPWDA